MNLNDFLIELLEQTGLPVQQDEYSGRWKNYIVFTYADERPELTGDDRVIADTCYLQIQLITPKETNYFGYKKHIRDLLEGAGFIVTSTQSFLNDMGENVEKTRQTVFEVEYTAGRKEF